MKNMYDIEEVQTLQTDTTDIADVTDVRQVRQVREVRDIADVNAGNIELTGRNSGFPEVQSSKKGISRLLNTLPALPRIEDKAQRRAGGNIIKFLAGLLALTLIARGTSGATLARVEVSAPKRSEIVESVTGKATVSARDSLDITAPEGLTIVEMLAGAGQTVNVGDAVALFDMTELEGKLIRESAALDKLLLDLEKADRTDRSDSTSLENAMRSLKRVQDDYEAVKAQGEADVKTAKEALDEIWAKILEDPDAAALEAALRNLNRVKDDYNSTLAQGIANIATAQSALSDAIAADATDVDSTTLESARRSRTRAREDYNTVKAQGEADVAAAQASFDRALQYEEDMKTAWEADETNTDAEQDYLDAKADTKKAQTALDAAKKKSADDLLTAARRLEDAEATYLQAANNYDKNSDQASDSRQSSIEKARDALAAEQKKAEDNLVTVARRLEDAEISYASAERDYGKNVEKASDARQTSIDNAQSALEAAQKKADDNLLSAARRVEDAEVSVATAQRDSSKNTQQSADTAATNSISAITLRLDIEDKKAIVDALKMLVTSNGVLYSDITGVVMSTKAEGSVTGKDALIAFMDSAKGFEAYILLDKDEADRLAVGDDCQVSTGGGSMYYNPTVAAIISAVGPPDDQNRARVTISLPEGDWSEGQRVDIRSVQSRNTYDQCVPLSAVNSDNTGYYLLTVEQKSTVLGIENILIRTSVNILASDDDNAAIQGSMGRNSQIVTGSNKAVAAGDRVRIDG
jgi:hypothetical protein